MDKPVGISRRAFATLALLAPGEAIVDLHQHTNYAGRSDEELVAHQRALGVTKTILLPSDPETGLDVQAGGNSAAQALSQRLPREFVWFCNESPNSSGAIGNLEKCLDAGACGIGEQKLRIECDSKWIHSLAALAAERRVPLLMHFQHGQYNTGYERFHLMLERYPNTNFIGHAQTFWGYIDLKHKPEELYPKGPVTPGGLTDRWLAGYPNFYGDLSAGSGLNALMRDEAHARSFLERHGRKLLFGTDCDDRVAFTERCSGGRQLALVRKLVTDAHQRLQILAGNAERLLNSRAW